MRICVANPKGGSGKSTLASHCLVLGAMSGWVSTGLDLDPQGSLWSWQQRRPIHAPLVNVVATESELARADQDLVVVDCPAAQSDPELLAQLDLADAWLLPCGGSPFELDALADLIAGLEKRNLRSLQVVINRVPESSISLRHARQRMREMGLKSVAWLRDSQRYHRAAEQGLAVFELDNGQQNLRDAMQWQQLAQALMPDAAPRLL